MDFGVLLRGHKEIIIADSGHGRTSRRPKPHSLFSDPVRTLDLPWVYSGETEKLVASVTVQWSGHGSSTLRRLLRRRNTILIIALVISIILSIISNSIDKEQDLRVRLVPSMDDTETLSILYMPPSSSAHALTYDDPRLLSNFAFAVKTSHEVMGDRLTRQLSSFLDRLENRIYISDHEDVLGDTPVHDCYTTIYEDAINRTRTGERRTATVREEEDGWTRDAHKNLPGFRILYEQFPDKDWFMMIDDDTYIFTQNLHDITHYLDPSLPLHMGWPLGMGPCGINDDMPDRRQGFYQGGSGILLSRGAMEILYEGIDECILKSWDCWAGDIRVSLCMWDVGLRVLDGCPHPYGFYVHDYRHLDPEQGIIGDPCIRPVTGHRMRGMDFHYAYMAEKISENGAVTFADIFHSRYVNTTMNIGPDFDVIDIDTVWNGIEGQGSRLVESVNECNAICTADPMCRSWTFKDETEECWFEESEWWDYKRLPKRGYVSGLKGSRYVCDRVPTEYKHLTVPAVLLLSEKTGEIVFSTGNTRLNDISSVHTAILVERDALAVDHLLSVS
ncbi:hypothetical protein G7K_6746-t1 [Saitoella complicata NRRL Y-17804]|uniref:N-acetylgalactosaminide beta-1,3-galactosyltransferase n=1 Tax=Saitoella complicata (strain BCRC 22490 / CBS 7301 / JCM 7358 / NBRC 10748 / NRRL Y-17804) TaxID=698492 RepID=A0A0E9NTD6_SAICN|nr:hypothetical protein G7K_6746-t1 [Saitoella complicata NRRL Y-17804]